MIHRVHKRDQDERTWPIFLGQPRCTDAPIASESILPLKCDETSRSQHRLVQAAREPWFRKMSTMMLPSAPSSPTIPYALKPPSKSAASMPVEAEGR